jgi:hypothetical protein
VQQRHPSPLGEAREGVRLPLMNKLTLPKRPLWGKTRSGPLTLRLKRAYNSDCPQPMGVRTLTAL